MRHILEVDDDSGGRELADVRLNLVLGHHNNGSTDEIGRTEHDLGDSLDLFHSEEFRCFGHFRPLFSARPFAF